MGAAPARDIALQQLSAMPGVVGSMLFGSSGAVVSSAFPPVFDTAGLEQLASQLSGDKYFQDWLPDDDDALDLWYPDGRVIIRSMRGAWLLVLCTAEANAPLLAMSLTQAMRRLRAQPAGGVPGGAAPARAAEPTALEKLRAIASEELGEHSRQALEILAATEPSPGDLARAVSDIERMTRLFISRQKAKEIGRSMRQALGA